MFAATLAATPNVNADHATGRAELTEAAVMRGHLPTADARPAG
jgi:hypothetical protein